MVPATTAVLCPRDPVVARILHSTGVLYAVRQQQQRLVDARDTKCHGNCHTVEPMPSTQSALAWCTVDQANHTVTSKNGPGTAIKQQK